MPKVTQQSLSKRETETDRQTWMEVETKTQRDGERGYTVMETERDRGRDTH